MSAETFIAFWGLRFELGVEELEGVELRSDRRIVAARKVGLNYYWGNFGDSAEKYVLFIGHKIGILGAENPNEVHLSLLAINTLIDDTTKKLADSGFAESPELHLAWQPDPN